MRKTLYELEEDLEKLEKPIDKSYVLAVLRCPSRHVQNLRNQAHRFCRYEELGWTRRRHAPGWRLPEDEAMPNFYPDEDEEIIEVKKPVSPAKRDERKPAAPAPAPRKVKKGLTRPCLNTPQPEVFLKQVLKNGPRRAAEIFEEAVKIGLTQSDMFNAKDAIGARARNNKDGSGWIWSIESKKRKPKAIIHDDYE